MCILRLGAVEKKREDRIDVAGWLVGKRESVHVYMLIYTKNTIQGHNGDWMSGG